MKESAVAVAELDEDVLETVVDELGVVDETEIVVVEADADEEVRLPISDNGILVKVIGLQEESSPMKSTRTIVPSKQNRASPLSNEGSAQCKVVPSNENPVLISPRVVDSDANI
jgi:hypothetical protein